MYGPAAVRKGDFAGYRKLRICIRCLAGQAHQPLAVLFTLADRPNLAGDHLDPCVKIRAVLIDCRRSPQE